MQETHTGILDPSLCPQVPFKFKLHMLRCGRFGFPRGTASTSFFRLSTQGWLEKENLTQVGHSTLEWCWAGVGPWLFEEALWQYLPSQLERLGQGQE